MKFILLFIITFLSLDAQGQIEGIDSIIMNQMKSQGIKGLSIGIVQSGKTLLNKGYGYANLEHQIPANENTVFRLASISKQFFTTAIMKLVEEKKLSLDDGIMSFFKDAPEIWKPIRIHHLMSHTSGLVREAPGYDNFKLQSDYSIITSAFSLPMDFPTGAQYKYCNLGYYILAEIITQVSGMPWPKYMEENLFKPAGMENTYLTDFYTIVPNRASGYVNFGDKAMNAEAMISIRPSGGFLSTTTDMIKWNQVLNDKNKILTSASWEELWKPRIKTSKDENSKSYYGYGWSIDQHKGHHTIGHGGSNMGFKTHFTRFVDEGLSIIVLTNTDRVNPESVVNAVADYLLKR